MAGLEGTINYLGVPELPKIGFEGLNLPNADVVGDAAKKAALAASTSGAGGLLDNIYTPSTSVTDKFGNVTNTAGSTFGINNEVLGGVADVASLGLGYLNYRDAHKMNKANLAGMEQNLANAKTEAKATADYRAGYGA